MKGKKSVQECASPVENDNICCWGDYFLCGLAEVDALSSEEADLADQRGPLK